MEIDNNNNQDSDSDDPTVELEPLSEAACNAMLQADDAQAESDAVAETEEAHEMCFEASAPASEDIASHIQRLRDELKYRADMNSILRHRNDQLREKCEGLAEQVSSLLKANETLSKQLERSRQSENPELADTVSDPELKLTSAKQEAGQRRSSGARRPAPARSPRTRLAPSTEVQDCLVLLGANGVDTDTWVLDDGINTIGSGPDCNVRIQSEFVSRHHAQLIRTQKGSVLEDLNSTNGTYINARRINKRAMRAGDLVTIGKHRLQYRQRSDRHIMTDVSKLESGLHSE